MTLLAVLLAVIAATLAVTVVLLCRTVARLLDRNRLLHDSVSAGAEHLADAMADNDRLRSDYDDLTIQYLELIGLHEGMAS